jgi:erythronate-4-phosphate dehydrogenase
MKIVADPNIPFVQEAFGPLGEVTLVPGRKMDAATVRDAELLLVRSVTPVHAGLLDGSAVKFVATATIGTDHVDEGYLAGHGIGFASAAGSNANSVAEYILAALLELARRQGFRLRQKTLGIVGVGNVGKRVLRNAVALGLRVLACDPPRQRFESLPKFVKLDQVAAEADIITLHVPLIRREQLAALRRYRTEDVTHHLFDGPRFGTLAQRPILINSSRGAVVDNRALLAAFQWRKVTGAVLDVWEGEPGLLPGLLDRVDLGTPHIAGYSFDGKVNGTRMIYEAACRHFDSEPTWQPSLPAVPPQELTVSPADDDEDVLRRVVRQSYDITADDVALRKAPHEFDRLRAEYPVRREFHNVALTVHGGTPALQQKLTALGFRVS